MYFDQLMGDARTQKLVETFFPPFFNLFCSFKTYFSDFMPEINKKRLKISKKIEKINICMKLAKIAFLVTDENMGLCLYIVK